MVVTDQARRSDWGKRATKIVGKKWGGRRADGKLDVKKKPSFFSYVEKHPSITRKGKPILKYETLHRRGWKSYGKSYEKKYGD